MADTYFYTDVTRIGNKIHCIGYYNGKKFYNKVAYKPKLYLYTNSPTQYRSIRGRYLDPMEFESMSEARNFIEKYRDVSNFDFCGMEKFEYAFIAEEFGDKLNYNLNDIVILYIDTEVSAEDGFPSIDRADKEFTLITAKYKDHYYTFGLKDYTPKADNVKYIKCIDERQLLVRFLAFWDKVRPDVITGWNIEGFDVPYLVRRIERVLGPEAVKKLSPYGRINERNFAGKFGKEQLGYEICGVAIYDYLAIYKKFANSQQESYKLDHIAHVELGVRKLDYSEYGNLTRLYNENFERYVDYNIRDTELIYRLEEKRKLIQLALSMAYSARCNLSDVFKQTVMWDCIIYNYLLKRNIIVPCKRQKPSREFPGAFVKDPVPGMYEWVTTFDLNSLYPSLIMHYNMGPDTYIDEAELSCRMASETDREKISAMKFLLDNMDSGRVILNNAYQGEHISVLAAREIENTYGEVLRLLQFDMTPNGALFDVSYKGFLAELLEQMYDERRDFKNKALQRQQQLIEVESELKKRGVTLD